MPSARRGSEPGGVQRNSGERVPLLQPTAPPEGRRVLSLAGTAVESERVNATSPIEPANGSQIDDAPVLPDLLDRIFPEQQLASVTADGAYHTRKRHDAISDRGAHG